MGRAVVAEEAVRLYVDNLVSKKQFALGLIIGQVTEQRDYVVHLARTPLQSDDVTEASPSKGKVKGKQAKKCEGATIDQWDASLVAQHAKQATRMLLGGFDVLGVFACTTSDTLQTSALTTLRQMLCEIHHTLAKCQYFSKVEGTEMLLLHLSCMPQKISCKTIDVSSSLSGPKPVDFKFQSGNRWVCFQCRLAIELTIPLPIDITKKNLIQQLKKGLDPFCRNITNAVAVVNGSLNGETPLDKNESGNKGKRGKHKETTEVPQQVLEVDLLVSSEADNSKSDVIIEKCGVIMNVKGTIAGRTYVPNKSVIHDGTQCLKHDILRSLMSRCDVHCEDLLVIDEEQQDRVVVHELPCRIFAPIPNLEISISDYIFPGEIATGSLDAFQELLDVSIDAVDIETNNEHLPESADLKSPSEDEDGDTGVPVAELLPPKAPKSCSYIFLGASIAIAFIAGGVSYYILLN